MTSPRLIRMTGWSLAGTFAVVGVIFLVIPGKVLAAFNWLAGGLGWPESTTQPYTLYLALAVGYMYVVTLLAWQMARHPEVRAFPWMLVQAKAASALRLPRAVRPPRAVPAVSRQLRGRRSHRPLRLVAVSPSAARLGATP